MQILDGSFFCYPEEVKTRVHGRSRKVIDIDKTSFEGTGRIKKKTLFSMSSMRVIDLGFSLLEYVVPISLEKYLHG